MKKLLTAALILWLATPSVHPQSPPPKQPKLGLLECGVALVVLAGGIIIVSKLCKLANKIPKPPGAPGATNAAPASFSGTYPTVALGNETVAMYDISEYATNAAWQGPDGRPYQTMYTFNLETSTDLRTFTNCLTVTGYISPTWVFTEANGVRTLAPRGSNAVVTLPLGGQQRFFRGRL